MAKKPQTSLLLSAVLLLVIACPSHQEYQSTKISNIDLAALAAIKDSLTDSGNPAGTKFLSTWDFTSPDPCATFSGITCSQDRVTAVTLGSGLAGSLAPILSNLTRLTQLILYRGLVTGPIPSELGQLTNLRVISLTNNRLTGTIPSSLSILPNLHTLDLSCNRLNGTIPPSLFTLPNLKVVILASNSLSGLLPRSLSTQLLHLDLRDNMLTGTLPSKLPSSLRYLSLSNNMMWGPLNGSFSEEYESDLLVYLDLSMNQFSGAIPSSLFRPQLSSLFLQRNNLSSIDVDAKANVNLDPSNFIPYDEGSILDLSHNFLQGQLSPLLAGVETLFLNNNRLMGTVPLEYIESVCRGTTKTLYLQHNYLSSFPLQHGLELPDAVSLCLSYNCMVPPVGLKACPASAGGQLSRPASQCVVFKNGSSTH